MKYLILAVSLTSSLYAQTFFPHDISILLPLPEELPTPHSLMSKDFIPKEAFKKIPQLDQKHRKEKQE